MKGEPKVSGTAQAFEHRREGTGQKGAQAGVGPGWNNLPVCTCASLPAQPCGSMARWAALLLDRQCAKSLDVPVPALQREDPSTKDLWQF